MKVRKMNNLSIGVTNDTSQMSDDLLQQMINSGKRALSARRYKKKNLNQTLLIRNYEQY